MKYKTKNPATGEILNEYELYSDDKINELIDIADTCYKNWRRTSFEHRQKLMYKAAEILEEGKEKYGETMTKEMGKTYKSAIAEVEKCAWVCRYYAENAADFLKDEVVETDASKSMISYQPLGLVLAVMPWNYPMWQVFRFAAPALMAGNVGLLKHASNVPQSALYIQEVFEKAGFPAGAFTTLLIKSEQVENILSHPKITSATLTGSEPAGASVASISGKNIKKTVLELGGSDAYIILEDADLKHAAKQCTESRLLNVGQSCIGAKRFIVVNKVYDEFLELFTQEMNKAKMGDPMKEVELGPMAREDLRDEVHKQVIESVEKGAKIHIGGEIPNSAGSYYPATILVNVKSGMPAYHDEIFGPVASVIKVKNEEEAIRIANDSKFGLGSCVFTKDLKRGERIAKEEIEAGSCFVNQFVKSDPRLPFGGIKSSGYGRELSYYGIREFVNIKTVYIK